MIQEAVYTSVWDDCTEIHSDCLVDTETKEVFNIELVDVSGYDIDVCTGEYVTLLDGSEYNVNTDDSEYWYAE